MRVYPFTKATSEPARATLSSLASREFRLLQDIDHPGVLRVLDFKESERGPALIFDHDRNAARLDFILHEHGSKLTAELRLHFIRQLAETLRYAHDKRLYHRSRRPAYAGGTDPTVHISAHVLTIEVLPAVTFGD